MAKQNVPITDGDELLQDTAQSSSHGTTEDKRFAPLFWQATVHFVTCSQAPTSSTDINTSQPLLCTATAFSATLPCRPGSSTNQMISHSSELLTLP